MQRRHKYYIESERAERQSGTGTLNDALDSLLVWNPGSLPPWHTKLQNKTSRIKARRTEGKSMNHKESKLENHKPKRPGLLIMALPPAMAYASEGLSPANFRLSGTLSETGTVRYRYSTCCWSPPGFGLTGRKARRPEACSFRVPQISGCRGSSEGASS